MVQEDETSSIEVQANDEVMIFIDDNMEETHDEVNPFKEHIVDIHERVDSTLVVLQKRKKSIGWTLVDIWGISPTFCMNKINLEESSKTFIEHQRRLNDAMQEGIVLGHKIQKNGIEVKKVKIEVISKHLPPTLVKGVRRFLGHAGFYRHFIKDFFKVVNPLCKLLEKDDKFHFNDDCMRAFALLKLKLTTTLIITAPNWSVPFELMCDASDVTICTDVVIRRCVPEEEQSEIFGACHSSSYGGHHGGARTAAKVLSC
uniref:Uncharacterized protein LOC104221894 n=1 Tax=Nicotiana sylvestris TaxID=4096 RepID=A0A1U7W9L1_NICSY